MLKLLLWVSLLLVAAIVLVFGAAFLKLQFHLTWLPSISYTAALVAVFVIDDIRRIVMD